MVKNKNFLITSTGRTGTKWLANVMNKSTKWTVYHEPRGFKNDSYDKAMFIFKNPYYSEVNGALLYDVELFECKKAIIQRDTKEITVSFMNRYDYQDMFNRLKLLKKANDFIKTLDIKVISFHKMTTDLSYLQSIFNYFGINDYIPTTNDLITKVNKTITAAYTDFDSLPKQIKDYYYKINIKEIEPNH